MIENLQIRVLKFPGVYDFMLFRTHAPNCTYECTEGRKNETMKTYQGASVKCYLMASLSNGAEVAQGPKGNFTLVPPFDEALNDFHCAGILIDKPLSVFYLVCLTRR